MTKEKAIEILQTKSCAHCSYGAISPRDCLVLGCELKSAINMAVKSLEQQPCEDCVSRQAVLDCLTATGLKKFDFILDSREKVNNLPPVTPARKVGKWIYDSGSYKCPFCEHEITGKEDDLNYCCKCGTEMRGAENG